MHYFYIPQNPSPRAFSDALIAGLPQYPIEHIALEEHTGINFVPCHAITHTTFIEQYPEDYQIYTNSPYSTTINDGDNLYTILSPVDNLVSENTKDSPSMTTQVAQAATTTVDNTNQQQTIDPIWKPLCDIGEPLHIENGPPPTDFAAENRPGIIVYTKYSNNRQQQAPAYENFNTPAIGRIISVDTRQRLRSRYNPSIFADHHSHFNAIAEVRPTPNGWAVIFAPNFSNDLNESSERTRATKMAAGIKHIAESMREWEYRAETPTIDTEKLINAYNVIGYSSKADTLKEYEETMARAQNEIKQNYQQKRYHETTLIGIDDQVNIINQRITDIRPVYDAAFAALNESTWIENVKIVSNQKFTITMNPEYAGEYRTIAIAMPSLFEPAQYIQVQGLPKDHPLHGTIQIPTLMEHVTRSIREHNIKNFLRNLMRLITNPERLYN